MASNAARAGHEDAPTVGLPNDGTPRSLDALKTGPWKRTIVYRDKSQM